MGLKDSYKDAICIWLMGLLPSICTGLIIPWTLIILICADYKTKNAYKIKQSQDKLKESSDFAIYKQNFIKTEFKSLLNGTLEDELGKKIKSDFPYLCQNFINNKSFEVGNYEKQIIEYFIKIGLKYYNEASHQFIENKNDWNKFLLKYTNERKALYRVLYQINDIYSEIINKENIDIMFYVDFFFRQAYILHKDGIEEYFSYLDVISWYDNQFDFRILYQLYQDKNNWMTVDINHGLKSKKEIRCIPNIDKIIQIYNKFNRKEV